MTPEEYSEDDNPWDYFGHYTPPEGTDAFADMDKALDAPETEKTLESNGNGTYTLSLSVKGTTRSTSSVEGHGHVVLVADVSASMAGNAVENMKEAMVNMGRALLEKHVGVQIILFNDDVFSDTGHVYTNKDDFNTSVTASISSSLIIGNISGRKEVPAYKLLMVFSFKISLYFNILVAKIGRAHV